MSLHGSLHQRRNIPPLFLDTAEIKKEQELTIQRFTMSDHDNMGERRDMSRLYVGLMNKIQSLKTESKLTLISFQNLCEEVQLYKQNFLPLLAANKLLYDDGHDPKNNHFNSEMLQQLEEIALKHSFPEGYVPFCVVQDIESSGDDDSDNDPLQMRSYYEEQNLSIDSEFGTCSLVSQVSL